MDAIKIMPGAAPFYYAGNRVGCLLVHGFTGTPFEMRWLGEYLHEQGGYTVYGPRLAGHGTSPELLAQVKWQEWYSCVVAGYELLCRQCDQVFVIGLSMGGALSLLLASQENVTGLVTLSAVYRIENQQKALFPFLRVIGLFTKTISKGYEDEGEARFQAQVRAEEEKRGEPPNGHPSYKKWVVPAVSQLLSMLKVMRAEIPNISAPSLHIHSRADETAPFENLHWIDAAMQNESRKTLELEKSSHCVCEDIENTIVFEAVATFIAENV